MLLEVAVPESEEGVYPKLSICLPPRRISDQKLVYNETISPINGLHPQDAGVVEFRCQFSEWLIVRFVLAVTLRGIAHGWPWCTYENRLLMGRAAFPSQEERSVERHSSLPPGSTYQPVDFTQKFLIVILYYIIILNHA